MSDRMRANVLREKIELSKKALREELAELEAKRTSLSEEYEALTRMVPDENAVPDEDAK